MYFEDRKQAGEQLAAALRDRVRDEHAIVLGLSYGGLSVALEVARALAVPLDAYLAAPFGGPFQRLGREPLAGRSVIVIDDGAATGETVLRAIDGLRQAGVGRLVVGLPVAPPFTCAAIEPRVDELICMVTPKEFLAVAACYARFPPVSPADAIRCLKSAPPEPRGERVRAPARSLAAYARGELDRLDGGLHEIASALASGEMEKATARLACWRSELAHHLAWETQAVLPAYVRRTAAMGSRIQAEHCAIHETLDAIARELAAHLERRPRVPDRTGQDLCDALKRKFMMHREREVYGLCAVLDAAGAQLDLPEDVS